MTSLDTAIVGGGQAGLGVSYFLQQNGNKRIVFEQGQTGVAVITVLLAWVFFNRAGRNTNESIH